MGYYSLKASCAHDQYNVHKLVFFATNVLFGMLYRYRSLENIFIC